MIYQELQIDELIIKEFQEGNLSEHLKTYHLFLDTLINSNETLKESGMSTPSWLVYSETLTIKFILHANSIYQLFLEHSFKSKQFQKDLKLLDLGSILVLTRTLLENFLMYWHIYVNPKSKEEQEFRFNVWALSSLLNRIKNRHSRNSFTEELKTKEDNEVIEYTQKIKSSEFLKTLTLKQQSKLLNKGEGKLFKDWRKIIEESGFSDDRIWKEQYGYLSGFTHSDGLSIAKMRFTHFKHTQKKYEEAILHCYTAKMLMSRFIMNLVERYKIVEVKFNTFPLKDQGQIMAYNNIASKKRV